MHRYLSHHLLGNGLKEVSHFGRNTLPQPVPLVVPLCGIETSSPCALSWSHCFRNRPHAEHGGLRLMYQICPVANFFSLLWKAKPTALVCIFSRVASGMWIEEGSDGTHLDILTRCREFHELTQEIWTLFKCHVLVAQLWGWLSQKVALSPTENYRNLTA